MKNMTKSNYTGKMKKVDSQKEIPAEQVLLSFK